jgi:hypothetical protein
MTPGNDRDSRPSGPEAPGLAEPMTVRNATRQKRRLTMVDERDET